MKPICSLWLMLLLFGCTAQTIGESYSEPSPTEPVSTEPASIPSDSTTSDIPIQDAVDIVGVTDVEVSQGAADSYTFSVTIQSPDTGCDRYANWWEVVTEDGRLLYRRILAHSHVDEQPFTRSGGPVEMAADEVVIVRSHMHPTGYHTQAMKGTFTDGFESATLPADFAIDLSEADPLPTGCGF